MASGRAPRHDPTSSTQLAETDAAHLLHGEIAHLRTRLAVGLAWAAMLVALIVVTDDGPRRAVLAVGDLAAAASVTLAIRRKRPPVRGHLWVVVGGCVLLAIATAPAGWLMTDTNEARIPAMTMALLLNAVTPIVAWPMVRPYAQAQTLWLRMVPVIAYLWLLPVLGVAQMLGGSLSPVTATVLGAASFGLGAVFAAPTIWRIGRVADVAMYGSTAWLMAGLVRLVSDGPDAGYASASTQFMFAACIATAVWHPSMVLTGTPVAIEPRREYRQHRTSLFAAVLLIESTVFAASTRNNHFVVAVAAGIALVVVVHGIWVVRTGRSTIGDLRLRWELNGAIARGEIGHSLQPIASVRGTQLGSMVWATWHHRRLGTLAASEWWHLAERVDLVSAVERAVLAHLLEVAASVNDLGIVVVTLDEPSRHREELLALGRCATVVVRCNREFDIVRGLGAKVATGVEDLVPARPEIVVIPASVTTWCSRPDGADALAGIVTIARRAGAMTLALGVASDAVCVALDDSDVDMVAGYAIARPCPQPGRFPRKRFAKSGNEVLES